MITRKLLFLNKNIACLRQHHKSLFDNACQLNQLKYTHILYHNQAVPTQSSNELIARKYSAWSQRKQFDFKNLSEEIPNNKTLCQFSVQKSSPEMILKAAFASTRK